MSATDFSQNADDFRRIEKAIQFIEANFKARPGLEQIARSVHLSKYHFDRLFKRWAGISPVRFMQYLTLEYTKQKLVNARSVLDTALDAGLSGPGRLHDLYVTFDAMTPGEFKKKGAGLKIEYGFQPTPFGKSLLALTRRGICYLGFVNKDHPEDTFNQLLETYPGADFSENSQYVSGMVKRIFRGASEKADVPFNLQIKEPISKRIKRDELIGAISARKPYNILINQEECAIWVLDSLITDKGDPNEHTLRYFSYHTNVTFSMAGRDA